ncbi:alpha/beta fold hydrolase [Salsipaludibacter albus]|uniref:alpha/beta fold hydrolase n=1 Tax=Salsipaludibacter albus TaxID=2849650 RepID=UPI001EE49CE7|nr:alpha/beta hydrolase [Salsipaludibacter albus]MBY5162040.1 alpha/beta hydrolase [Salsipaludibacter albus]
MSDTTTNDPQAGTTSHELDVPGATLAWDLRPGTDPDAPILLMTGHPMGAGGFGTQASHFTDRTVITHDPRGVERSTAEPSDLPLVERCVADLHALLGAVRDQVGDRPVDVFASSGGAVNALALVAAHPDDVRTLVAHEPPTLGVLDDADAANAAWAAVHDTYMARGWGHGMAHFIALTSQEGEFPDDWSDEPVPDPEMFGMPTADDGSRGDPLLSQDETGIPSHELDLDAVAAAPTRVVIAVGAETGDTMTGRTSRAVAARLGTEAVEFPGGHGGFLGGEYGQMGEPDAFAAALRAALDATA